MIVIGGFRGDGQSYYILEYNERKMNKIIEQNLWRQVDSTSIETLSGYKNDYQQLVETIDYEQEKKFQKIFKENPVEYTKGDKYFYKSAEDGSYFIAVLNKEKQKLFLMEWFQ